MRRRLRGWSAWLGAAGLAAALAAGCSGSEMQNGTPAGGEVRAAEKLAALGAHEGFLDALRAGDAATASSFLDAEPELLLFPVAGRSRLEGPEEARLGLDRMLRGMGPAEWTVVHARATARPSAVWVTYLFAVESERFPAPMLGRGTEIWVRRGSDWKLAHGHWSPEPAGA